MDETMEANQPRALSMLFQEVADLVRQSPASDQAVSNDTRLRLYGLYKRVKGGPCLDTSDAPTRLHVVARAKYQSWAACSSLSKEQAMMEYVELVSMLDNDVGRECAERIYEWKRANEASETTSDEGRSASSGDDSLIRDEQNDNEDEARRIFRAPNEQHLSSSVADLLGIRPMVPRGRLDISYADLGFAALQCLKQNNMRRYCQLEDDISSLWNRQDSNLVVGLSVRSLLDLYLRAMSFPKGSQVIVAPAINIPGMMEVLRHHDIEIVPVDMMDGAMRVDCSAVAKAITDKTVAIMVVHPFGQSSTTPEDMEALRKVADSHGLQLWDDKAECFAGIQNTMIDTKADLSFVSFGTIKTCTALGGGLAFVRSQEAAYKMKRLHYSVYSSQSTSSYLFKIIGCVIMKFVTEYPILYGLIFALCQHVGLNFDTLVYVCVRSFSHNTPHHSTGRNDNQETRPTQMLIKQLRYRPSVALLSLLQRRLSQNMRECSAVYARIKRCKVMARLLSGAAPHISLIDGNALSTCWLFPVCVDDPESLCRSLRDKGWDVTRGSSQLQCIADGSSSDSKCPRAHTLMQKVVYLPITSVPMTAVAMQHLAADADDAASSSVPNTLCCSRGNTNRFSQVLLLSLFVCLVLLMGATSVLKVLGALVGFAVLCCSAATAVAIQVRRSVAELYVGGSLCFAKYNKLLYREEIDDKERKIPSLKLSLLGMKALTLPAPESLHEADDWSHIVVTGATGFIGSMVLRDLLLHRTSLKVEGVILLCRSKRGLAPADRISMLLDKAMFNFLTAEQKASLVHVVNADVTKARAGLSEEDYALICYEKPVSCVIHCAASVKFTQSLRDAAISNIASALNMQKLVADLKSSSAQYVHISTAFVHGDMTGTSENPLSERLYPLRGYDPHEIYNSMLGTQFYASSAMTDLGFPNTYAFSKCVSEHLLLRDCSVATIIIRPSIVGPAIEEPNEGWAGDRPSTIVAAACLYLRYQWNLWCFGAHRVPYVPVDVVARFVLAKAFAQERVEVSCSSPSPSSSDEEFEKISLPRESSFEPSKKEHCQEEGCIYNATWDSASAEASGFSWVDYAVTVTHVGTIMGYFSRFTAYVGLLVAVRWLPYFKLSIDTYAQLHKYFVQLPVEIISWTFAYIGWHPDWMKDLSRLSPFLDLPLLFFPFMNNDFFFRSELVAPEGVNGERYLFLCAASAVRLLGGVRSERSGEGQLEGSLHRDSVLPIHFGTNEAFADFWWAITKPTGGIALRLAGWAFRKILRACSVSLTVDMGSFSALAQQSSERHDGLPIHKVLAPTHRSFFDFILLSYIAFALPELGLEIPYIAASDDFSQIPLIGWAARMCKAFFVQRGLGRPDPELHEVISAIKANQSDRGACIEVFVEGTRSRDRRFVHAKTGLLRCLSETGGDHLICPIVICYETVPEESIFLEEMDSANRRSLNLCGLLRWLKDVCLGKIVIGNIHVAASPPLHNRAGDDLDYSSLAIEIQGAHQNNTFVSTFHIQNISKVLHLDDKTVQEALKAVGCKQWPSCHRLSKELETSVSPMEQWLSLLHAGHLLAPYIAETHPLWSRWLDPVGGDHSSHYQDGHCVRKLVDPILKAFDHVDSAVDDTINDLRNKSFEHPSIEHVTNITSRREPKLLVHFVRAAASFRIKANVAEVESRGTLALEYEKQKPSDTEETLGSWGFGDSGFVLCKSRDRALQVVMKGSRYDICGQPLPKLVPFIENETGIRIEPLDAPSSVHVNLSTISSDLSDNDLDHLQQVIHKVSTEPVDLARHGTGHSQEDVYLLRFGGIAAIRLPDAVVWPSSEDEVVALVGLAKTRKWCLIPHGGGTNVSNATRCPAKKVEPRPIISVDMKLMKHILWLNEEDGVARVEAGITGLELVEELGRRGYTIGHEPDSIEFSTLGGWIATKASGMKRNKYGNIEDIVKSVRVVGAEGMIWRGLGPDDCHSIGRESRGLDLCSLMFGSEGCFGVITSAIVRVWPMPECRDFEGVILPDFGHGIRFMRELASLESNLPASVRLLDNEQFRLGQALRTEASGLLAFVNVLRRVAMTTLRSYAADRVVCATIVFEGSRDEVRTQRKLVQKAAAAHGGTLVGPKVGRAGYQLTFAIAYLRDFAMTYSFLGESFETFAPWSKLQSIVDATKEKIQSEHDRRCLPGRPFIGCRITQLYHEGACLYFYFCMSVRGVKNPSMVFSQLEHVARDEILSLGGSLSHHHGIGKKRAGFAKQIDSESFRGSVNACKEALDPSNVFGARNGCIG